MVGLPKCRRSQAKCLIYAAENTAGTLGITIAFLELHDHLQRETHNQIMSVVGDERHPVCTVLISRVIPLTTA